MVLKLSKSRATKLYPALTFYIYNICNSKAVSETDKQCGTIFQVCYPHCSEEYTNADT
nr:MAG TPA: hypothetical protein [Caudoviricetes sp.]